jgi:hypothetical protein
VLTKASRPTRLWCSKHATGRWLSVVEPNCSGCLSFAACRSTTVDNAVEGHLRYRTQRYGRNCTRSTSAVIGRNGLLIVVVIARPQVKLERRSGCVQHCAAPSAAAVLPHGRLQQPKRCGPGALPQGSAQAGLAAVLAVAPCRARPGESAVTKTKQSRNRSSDLYS